MYLSQHKPEWQQEFLDEQQKILAIYSGGIQLLHIGSTAVEGLVAKDCIDILGVVDNIKEVAGNIKSLENLGYNHKGSYGIQGREYFSKLRAPLIIPVSPEGRGLSGPTAVLLCS